MDWDLGHNVSLVMFETSLLFVLPQRNLFEISYNVIIIILVEEETSIICKIMEGVKVEVSSRRKVERKEMGNRNKRKISNYLRRMNQSRVDQLISFTGVAIHFLHNIYFLGHTHKGPCISLSNYLLSKKIKIFSSLFFFSFFGYIFSSQPCFPLTLLSS